MKLREECIGATMTGTTASGYVMTVVIEDNKKLFKLYKNLGLDVFVKKVKRESTESND
jgi:hypothetical protein